MSIVDIAISILVGTTPILLAGILKTIHSMDKKLEGFSEWKKHIDEKMEDHGERIRDLELSPTFKKRLIGRET